MKKIVFMMKKIVRVDKYGNSVMINEDREDEMR